MKALTVLYGGRRPGVEKVIETRFPGAEKTLFFGIEGECPSLPPGVQAVKRPLWTKKSLLEEIALAASGYDLVYFAWADCPLLDAALAEALARRHINYAAEYSYADGWPYGFAPEVLAPETAGILAKIIGDDDGPVERDALFSVIQKDINAFDIETEISPVDLRHYRLSLSTDSKRNRLWCPGLQRAALHPPLMRKRLSGKGPNCFALFRLSLISRFPPPAPRPARFVPGQRTAHLQTPLCQWTPLPALSTG